MVSYILYRYLYIIITFSAGQTVIFLFNIHLQNIYANEKIRVSKLIYNGGYDDGRISLEQTPVGNIYKRHYIYT